MLERLLVALLAGGHVLLEGVPGLAKTLTVKTLAQRARRHVPAHPVHAGPRARPTSSARASTAPTRAASTSSSARSSATSCSPTRSTARPRRSSRRCSRSCRSTRSRSAARRFPVPHPFLVMATQNPIESEGTYPLPEAQVDRFLFKVVVDYPTFGEEAAVVGRSLTGAGRACASCSPSTTSSATRRRRAASSSTATSSPTPSQLADATRNPSRYGLEDLDDARRVRRQPARADRRHPGRAGARAAARPRARDRRRTSRDLAPDVLRHRLVLSYDALSDGVTADDVLDRVLAAVEVPPSDHLRRRAA